MIKYVDLGGWYQEDCKKAQQAASQSWACNLTNGSLCQEGIGGMKWAWNAYAAQPQQTIITVDNWYSALVGGEYQTTATSASSSQYLTYQYAMGSFVDTTEHRAKLRQVEAKREAAKLRAERLLFTILTPSQVKRYTDDGYFEQEVGGRIYRLHANSRSGNVILLEDGKPKFKYCAHPEDSSIPIPDVLLSQLLALRSNEAEFLRIANRTEL